MAASSPPPDRAQPFGGRREPLGDGLDGLLESLEFFLDGVFGDSGPVRLRAISDVKEGRSEGDAL